MLDSKPLLLDTDFPSIKRKELTTLQVNLGFKCNQSCVHCHVNAGPRRTEMMSQQTVNDILDFLSHNPLQTLDITGGAPEMNPHFKTLVREARKLGLHVINRCNLTILQEPGFEGLAEFFAQQQLEIIASMPCYLEENVDAQRGNGVYEASIQSLQELNSLGYGQDNNPLQLNLVYNPGGAYLPPPQQALENDYKRELFERHAIRFNHLYSITNMPILRFGSYLQSKGEFDHYMNLLVDAFQPENLDTLMCRELISVDWQGYLYDCDFNQMLDMPMLNKTRQKMHLRELNVKSLNGRGIRIAQHCYGCTAGQGSSCSGALS